MNCDKIAPFYELVERLAFGKQLQRRRLTYLAAAAGKRRVLVLGDGDGRFTKALMHAYPHLRVDSVELSEGMVAQARKRHVDLLLGDAMSYKFCQACYDVVFTHFFLDCFETEEVGQLVASVGKALKPEAIWIVSDFRQVTTGWRRIYTAMWLKSMYLFFRWMTGLKTQALPNYGPALARADFSKLREQVSRAGLIASEWWQR